MPVRLMRVLFVTGSYPPMLCGVGDYTATLAAEISKQEGVEVGVLTSVGAADSPAERRVNAELMPLIQHWRFSELPKAISVIRRWRPDIVHIQYPTLGYGKNWMPYFLPLLLKFIGMRVVQTWHEPPTRFRFFPNALTRDVLIGVEPDYLRQISKRYAWLVKRKANHFIPVGSSIPRAELTDAERAQIRQRYVGSGKNMVVNFGFVYPTKRVETLFRIADPQRDIIVLATHLDVQNNPYHQEIMRGIEGGIWAGKVVVTGFLEAEDVAKVLCAADAAIFPFQNGVGMRNTSFLAAKSQGTFTITTSNTKQGYDPETNVYFAHPGDDEAMRDALNRYKGKRLNKESRESFDWANIASEHISLYRDIVSGLKNGGPDDE